MDIDALKARHSRLCAQYDGLIGGTKRQRVTSPEGGVDYAAGDPAALLRQIGLVERQIRSAGGVVDDPRTNQGGPKSAAVWG